MIALLATALTLSLPVHVDGEGYMRFVRDGRIVYAASANLVVQDGLLGSKGLPLTPSVRVPGSAVRIEIDLSGNILAEANGGKTNCGRIVLARFDSRPVDDHGFLTSTTRASIGNPGEGTFGVIRTSGGSTGTNVKSNPTKTTIAAATPGSPDGRTAITVLQIVEVESGDVRLKDIGAISGDEATKQALASITYCPAPPIGIDMPVTASRIQALLKRSGIVAEVQVPQGAVIRRKAQAIKADGFVAVATKAAQDKIGAELPMSCTDQQGDFKAPFGEIELKAEGVTSSGTNFTVVVAVYADGKRINSRSVNLKVDASAQIMAGAAVKIVMKSSGVTVEVPGKTRTSGMIGQTVTVVTETGSVLTGIVVGPDKVEVKL